MKKLKSQGRTVLCLLAWSCLEFALGEPFASPANTSGEETSTKAFLREVANGTIAQRNLSAQCIPLLPPSDGFLHIEEGSGSSLGSVATYWCRAGYQLVGKGKLTCLVEGSRSYWSHPPPHCEVIPKPMEKGFRVAVIASVISGMIIVTVSISFAVFCVRDRMMRETEHGNGSNEESQENLQKGAVQPLCSEIHIFPQVVLKPGTIPSASMFVHLPQTQGDIPLTVKSCHPEIPPNLPSAYYRRYEALQLLNKQ